MIFPEVFTRSNNFLASIKLSSKKGGVGVMSNIEKYRAVMRKNRENWRQEIWFPCRGQIQSSYCRNTRGPPAGAGWQETIMRCKPSPTMRCSANITFLINLEKSIVGTWHHKTLVWLAPSRIRVEICPKRSWWLSSSKWSLDCYSSAVQRKKTKTRRHISPYILIVASWM